MKKACSKLLNPNPLSPRFGFTLIELLVVISITVILFTIGTVQYMKFNRQQILGQAVLGLKTNLTQARNMALAGKKKCDGIFDGILVEFDYDDENYTVYSSCDNKTDLTQIKFYELTRGVGLSSGPATILFKALIGGTDLNDTAVILLAGSNGAGGASVTPGGKIEIVVGTPSAGPCAGTPESCGAAPLCLNCDDSNECTLDRCQNNEYCYVINVSNGMYCNGGGGVCWQAKCCLGCVKPLGGCEAGTSNSYCGTGGDFCVDCTASGQICENGVCVNP